MAGWDFAAPADESYVEIVRETSRQLIRLDSLWGGIDVVGLAKRAFHVVRQRINTGGYPTRVERDLHAAGAELAEVAGWIAFDAERQELATELNHEALYLARLAGDRDVEHLTLLNASLQAWYLRHERKCVATAQTVIDDGRITSRVHAMALVRQARAYSRMGNRADAFRTFGQAQSLFLDGVSDRDPSWAWWIDAHEIDGHFAALHTDLGDHRRGIPMLYDVVTSSNKETPRYRVVLAGRLLAELVAVRAWHDAQDIAGSLAKNTASIGSARAITLLRSTAEELHRADAPATLRDTIDHVIHHG
nr:hypothetical protein [Kibdelosporangium sp. MJ126-NF4]